MGRVLPFERGEILKTTRIDGGVLTVYPEPTNQGEQAVAEGRNSKKTAAEILASAYVEQQTETFRNLANQAQQGAQAVTTTTTTPVTTPASANPLGALIQPLLTTAQNMLPAPLKPFAGYIVAGGGALLLIAVMSGGKRRRR